MNKEKLKLYAKKLMFEMEETEYDTLLNEFNIIEKQISMIEKIENIDKVEPMIFPFVTYKAQLRKDEEKEALDVEEVLKNSSSKYLDQVKVPKVVE